MKICIVTPRYIPNTRGGGEISCHLLSRELSKIHDVEVISFDGDGDSKENIEGVNVIRKRKLSEDKIIQNIQCFSFLRKLIYKYDIIHTYNMDLMPAIGLLTKKYNVKSIATLNGAVFSRQGEWYSLYKNNYDIKSKIIGFLILCRNMLLMHFIKGITTFTTLCPFYKSIYNLEGITNDKIEVIPNMIDRNFIVKLNKNNIKKAEILYLGNYRWRKGLDILIKAYSMLKKQNVNLTIAGFGSDRRKIETLIKNMKIPNTINLFNRIPYKDAPDMYFKADIFIQPYRYPEPIGRTLIESMQSGLCVITTGENHHSPIIRNMIDGILVYPCTAKRIKEKMQLLIDDHSLMMRIKEEAKKRVYEICDPDKIIGKYIKVYDKILSEC